MAAVPPGYGTLGPGPGPVTDASAAALAPKPARAGWPAIDTLQYHKTLIELLLLVLAIPWIVRELLRHPGQVSRRAARHHLGSE